MIDLDRAYSLLTLARQLDERMWRLARSGRAHFAVPAAGHEAIGVGYALALTPGYDFVAPHYRDLSAMLGLGLTPREVMLHFFARAADPCSAGRQPYAHWGSHRLRIITLQGPQPNHVSHGVGVALGSRLLGEDAVTWIGFGDGGAQKGEVHEALNLAAVHRLPCVFCIEANGYTQSVPARLQYAVGSLATRAAGYGVPGVSVDGMDVEAVYAAANEAIERARNGGGPTLLEARCYRMLPNTSNDDDRRYRSEEEVDAWRARDPVGLVRERIQAVRARALDEAARAAVEDAVSWAEAQPFADVATVQEGTYA